MATFYIKHLTKYSYSNPVIDGANQIMLYPILNENQEVLSQKISISNNPYVATYIDFYKNLVGTFMVIKPHNFLSIESEVEVKKTSIVYPEEEVDVANQWKILKEIKDKPEFIDFLTFIRFDGTQEIKEIIASKDLSSLSPYNMVMYFCEYIYSNFKYIKGITNVKSKLDEAWKMKAGVCQDFTSILLQMVRMLGIPARYVSGYICPSDETSRGEGATHAWIEAYIPNYGWLGIDPTNNLIANLYHVKLAVGRSYKDCTPVKGVFKGNVEEELFVKVKVSTVKSNIDAMEFPDSDAPILDRNSYRHNLALIEQEQQQQQQ